MSRRCEVCGKGSMVGNRVSHAQNKTKHRFMPNLQSIRTMKDGRVKRMNVCTRCIRGGKVQKAIRGYRNLETMS